MYAEISISSVGCWNMPMSKNIIFLNTFSPINNGFRFAKNAADFGMISTGNITSENRNTAREKNVHIKIDVCFVLIRYAKNIPMSTNIVVMDIIAMLKSKKTDNMSIPKLK